MGPAVPGSAAGARQPVSQSVRTSDAEPGHSHVTKGTHSSQSCPGSEARGCASGVQHSATESEHVTQAVGRDTTPGADPRHFTCETRVPRAHLSRVQKPSILHRLEEPIT